MDKDQTLEVEEVVGGEDQTNETKTERTEAERETAEKTPSEEEVVPTSEEVEEWKKKFSHSSREALRLYEENKKLKAQVEELVKNSSTETPPEEILKSRISDWEYLDEEQKNVYLTLFEVARKEALKTIKELPEIKLAREIYEKQRWEEEFRKIIPDFPELTSQMEEFRAYSYQSENVSTPLKTLAKSFLYDIAEEKGAKKEREIISRAGLERSSGGAKTPTLEKTEEDWNRLARTNPQEFLNRKKEFEAWLAKNTK